VTTSTGFEKTTRLSPHPKNGEATETKKVVSAEATTTMHSQQLRGGTTILLLLPQLVVAAIKLGSVNGFGCCKSPFGSCCKSPPPRSSFFLFTLPRFHGRSRTRNDIALHLSPSARTTTLLSAAEADQYGTRRTNSGTIRLNKVFKSTHSRREADRLILGGRVNVNGRVSYGCMVTPFQDIVQLDGVNVVGWEQMNAVVSVSSSSSSSYDEASSLGPAKEQETTTCLFEYIKYWKPQGVTCTTDRRIGGNIMDEITNMNGYRPIHRVYPVGRLDKDSTGLILLTSDGRLPNASLRHDQKQTKRYGVTLDRRIAPCDVQMLRDGMLITTIAQRDRTTKPITAYTKPCHVHVTSPYTLEITLTEGRNRQIRKMLDVLGYTVVDLHRLAFGPITLQGLTKAGDWSRLEGAELEWVQSLVQ
jgi:23S rRNA pseudouridine2604 synthase